MHTIRWRPGFIYLQYSLLGGLFMKNRSMDERNERMDRSTEKPTQQNHQKSATPQNQQHKHANKDQYKNLDRDKSERCDDESCRDDRSRRN